jgi:hypothetical protein
MRVRSALSDLSQSDISGLEFAKANGVPIFLATIDFDIAESRIDRC